MRIRHHVPAVLMGLKVHQGEIICFYGQELAWALQGNSFTVRYPYQHLYFVNDVCLVEAVNIDFEKVVVQDVPH